MAVSVAYLVATLVAALTLWVLLVVTEYQKSTYYVLMFSTTIISCAGYYFVSVSTNVNEALLGTKLTYVGGTFLTLFTIRCLCDICNIKVPHWCYVPLMLANIEITGVVWSIQYNKWHYSAYKLIRENGFAYLEKEYGPHHVFYLFMIILYMILSFSIVIYSINNRKKVSWIYTSMLGGAELLIALIYFIERAVGLKIDLMPFGYVVFEVIVLIILRRINLFNVQENITYSLSQDSDHGYVILDAKRKFIVCDDIAKVFFPELEDLSIDTNVNDPYLRHEFGAWISASTRHEVNAKYYQRNGRDIKVAVRPFYTHSGKKLLGYVIHLSDDTVNQEFIRKLKRATKRSEEMAKRADEANAAKTEFLANVSHELRTPINGILGFDEMILRETAEDNIRNYAMDIKNSGNALMGLINDLLDLSKIEAGKMDLVLVSYDFGSMLAGLINVVKLRTEDKGLEFVQNIAEDMPRGLYGDEKRTRQILSNLLINAVKYTDKGSVTLNISYEKEDAFNILIKVDVEDTGIGMKKEDMDRLFVPYERADEIRNRNIEGTGLGLSITQKILHLMDSKLEVSSAYGVGSTFSFAIRQRVEDWTPFGNVSDSFGMETNGKYEYKELLKAPDAKVLVVDDTVVNILIFKGLTKRTQINVEEAHSGRESVEMCRKTKYDIVYMDHMMPGMDGLEAFRLIREDREGLNKDTPIVMMTANASAGMKEMYLSGGFDHYISKPVDPEGLERSLIRFLPKEKVILTEEGKKLNILQ